ncbi:MAG: hypothetical protein K0S11_1108 [Gammaproteobacteria bacterium]|jgi:hypothetical protein|nr:hypothetical protein [Gammaproteobacteria bacterium]
MSNVQNKAETATHYYVPISLRFKNLATNTNASINLGKSKTPVSWSFGEDFTNADGFRLSVGSGALPLQSIRMVGQTLALAVNSTSRDNEFINFNLNAYLLVESEADKGSLFGSASLNPTCKIEVVIGDTECPTWTNGSISGDWTR